MELCIGINLCSRVESECDLALTAAVMLSPGLEGGVTCSSLIGLVTCSGLLGVEAPLAEVDISLFFFIRGRFVCAAAGESCIDCGGTM